MSTTMPNGFKQIWGILPQDPKIFSEFNSREEFARFVAGSVGSPDAESTANYIAQLRSRGDLGLDALNDLLREAGSQFYFFDRDELLALLAAIEEELRKK